jgi:hypothetical protein
MQRRIDRMKDELGASDEEMAALSPKIMKVMQLQFETNARAFGGGGGRGGQGGGGGGFTPPGGDSDVRKAIDALQQTLDNKDSKPEEIKAKLDAVRAAKTKAHDELGKAQTDLRSLLTQRQEAVLVMRGLLE